MKVYIIDDSDYKIEAIERIVHKRFPTATISVAKSFQSGLKLLETASPELIILDMTLPTSERGDGKFEGRNRIFGGRELMDEIEFLEIEPYIILVTQFEEFTSEGQTLDAKKLFEQLSHSYGNNFLGGVFYSIDSSWVTKFENIIEDLVL